jgi:hypothetical protein
MQDADVAPSIPRSNLRVLNCCGPHRRPAADNLLCADCEFGYAEWSGPCVACEGVNGGGDVGRDHPVRAGHLRPAPPAGRSLGPAGLDGVLRAARAAVVAAPRLAAAAVSRQSAAVWRLPDDRCFDSRGVVQLGLDLLRATVELGQAHSTPAQLPAVFGLLLLALLQL